jgi:iron(III) transport system permease protein
VLLVGVPLGNLVYKAGVIVSQVNVQERAANVVGTRRVPSDGSATLREQQDDGTRRVPTTYRVREFSPGQCVAMIVSAPWRCRRELGWSLLICPLAAGAAVLVAVPLAWLARRGHVRSLPALCVAALALAVPGPILGLGIIKLLDRPELPWLATLYDRSILAPFLALMVRGLPPAIFVLWYALRTVPREMLEAAAVDGAGPLARFWLIALPLRWPAVVLAFVVALAVALGDLAASILVMPPGVQTLSIHIFNLLHYGVEDQVAGVCLALLALFAALTAAGWGIIRMMKDKG